VLAWSLLVVAFVPMLLEMIVRMVVRHEPRLRLKPGEKEAEASLLTLGSYRIYTWLIWVQVLFWILQMIGRPAPLWLSGPLLAAELLLAHAVYWRLGFGWSRFFLVLGHISGVVALTEAYYFLRIELAPAQAPRPS
jgi:hypothetical protein